MPERDLGRTAGIASSGHPGVVAVGLTGAIGAGKSTALSMFRELGAVTTSADAIVHDLYLRPDYISGLVEHFGEGILDRRGAVNRRGLARLVNERKEELRWLERLTHPLVIEEVMRVIREAPAGSVVVCEVPLMFETGFERLFDLVVTIEAARNNRVSRSADRFDPAVFDEFESLQATSVQRIAGSHLVFHNDGSPEHLREFIQEVYAHARARLGAGL